MTQALLYSIAPEYINEIAIGNKTIEVRKRDLPQWAKDKLAKGEDVLGYGYCTNGKPYLYNAFGRLGLSNITHNELEFFNGKVVVKFRVSGTTKYVDCSGCTNNENGYECENDFMYLLSVDPILRKETCLTSDEIEDYGNGKDLYAHHLSDITPVEMELVEFYREIKNGEIVVIGVASYHDGKYYMSIERPPQSFQSVWTK